MSVIVKGMEMPDNCGKCPMNCRMPDGKILCRRDFQERNPKTRDRCSILPLPEKHGRLIDADAISDEYTLMTCEIHGFRIELLGVGDERATLKFKPWREVPTIVEAEGDNG